MDIEDIYPTSTGFDVITLYSPTLGCSLQGTNNFIYDFTVLLIILLPYKVSITEKSAYEFWNKGCNLLILIF